MDGASSVRGAEDEEEDDEEEPRYCYCNGISYGEMVACDMEGCKREWFHLDCVGLSRPPTAKCEFFTPSFAPLFTLDFRFWGRRRWFFPRNMLMSLFKTAKWYCDDCKPKLEQRGQGGAVEVR